MSKFISFKQKDYDVLVNIDHICFVDPFGDGKTGAVIHCSGDRIDVSEPYNEVVRKITVSL